MRISTLLLIAVAAFAFLFAACGDSEAPPPRPPAPAPPPPPPPEPPPPPATPVSGPGDAVAGKTSYVAYCASCHGETGEGDGPIGANLDPQPARHSDGSYMNALSNEHLVKVITLGGPAVGKSPLMAPWGSTLSDQQVADVIAYVRSLADPPYKP